MIQILVERIIKENNFTLIRELDKNSKQYLKEHIENSILNKYSYQPLEHIKEMIDNVIVFFENGLQAINYISAIHYKINDIFYEKLKEEYFVTYDDTMYDWEDEFYKSKEDIRLNKYTLIDFIDISFIDGIDLMVKQFEDNYKEYPYIEYYKKSIKDSLELYCKYKNREKKERKSAIDIFYKEPLEPLTNREINLVTADIILVLNKSLLIGCKEKIANDYNINNNTPNKNQEILNNSYDVIISKLEKLQNTNKIVELFEREKLINTDLFTNGKKLSKVIADNHYMSFLYKCNSVYTENDLIVFQEFVEALISGYMQFLEFEDKEQKIKSHKQDLEVLKRYNTSNENKKYIQELEDRISFLSISKSHQKFIPFKELSNRLDIDTNQISNYITNILINGTHKNTIKQNFDTLKTISKVICISKF